MHPGYGFLSEREAFPIAIDLHPDPGRASYQLAAVMGLDNVEKQGVLEIANDDDTVMTKNGVSLLIDAMSYQYLVGAEIDYKEDLQGAQFVIKNPNATSTCGCGSSFST